MLPKSISLQILLGKEQFLTNLLATDCEGAWLYIYVKTISELHMFLNHIEFIQIPLVYGVSFTIHGLKTDWKKYFDDNFEFNHKPE